MTNSTEMQAALDAATAGFNGDSETAMASLQSQFPDARRAGLFSLDRLGLLTSDTINAMMTDSDTRVRIAAAELSANYEGVNMMTALNDTEYLVAEMGAWACGERDDINDEVFNRLLDLGINHAHQLVREAAIAALGAIGDARGLPVILKGCTDKPAIRRRAVLALAPFDGPEVEAAIDAALKDKDWQVRQSAEDLRR